jgi:hypothetical protein
MLQRPHSAFGEVLALARMGCQLVRCGSIGKLTAWQPAAFWPTGFVPGTKQTAREAGCFPIYSARSHWIRTSLNSARMAAPPLPYCLQRLCVFDAVVIVIHAIASAIAQPQHKTCKHDTNNIPGNYDKATICALCDPRSPHLEAT